MARRRDPSRRREGEYYAYLPLAMLQSDAYKTLSNASARVLVAIAAGYRGANNGDLCLTWNTCRDFGVRSKAQLAQGLKDLMHRGLIQKTRQGGKPPLGPCLYALTWVPINDISHKFDAGVKSTYVASNAWVKYKDPEDGKKIAPRAVLDSPTGGA